MSLQVPYIDDLATNSKLPGQLADNFKQVQAEDASDDAERKKLDEKYQIKTDDLYGKYGDLKDGENELNNDKLDKMIFLRMWKELDDKVNHYFDELDDKKASKKRMKQTFSELSQLIQQYHNDIVKLTNDNEQKMNDKAERVAMGTDMDTVRQVVMLILQEQGIVPATAEIPKIEDPDKAASATSEVAAVSSGEDSRAQAASAALAELNLPKE